MESNKSVEVTIAIVVPKNKATHTSLQNIIELIGVEFGEECPMKMIFKEKETL
jgi:hypothetical protein